MKARLKGQISHYLFIQVKEALSFLIAWAEEGGSVIGLKVSGCGGGVKLSYIQFPDGCLLFCDFSRKQLLPLNNQLFYLNWVLLWFEVVHAIKSIWRKGSPHWQGWWRKWGDRHLGLGGKVGQNVSRLEYRAGVVAYKVYLGLPCMLLLNAPWCGILYRRSLNEDWFFGEGSN